MVFFSGCNNPNRDQAKGSDMQKSREVVTKGCENGGNIIDKALMKMKFFNEMCLIRWAVRKIDRYVE